MKSPLVAMLLALPLLALPLHADRFANSALQPSNPPLQNARVDGLDIDHGQISVTDCAQLRSAPNARPICEGSAFNLSIDDPALRTKFKDIHVGDHIRIDFTLPDEKPGAPPPYKVTGVAGLAAPRISTLTRLGSLLTAFLLTFLLGALLTKGHPLRLVIGLDNRYSNSKLQAALWTWVLLTTYLQFLCIRIFAGGLDFLGGISIPQNLLLLSGMSAITFAGAKGITTAKANAANDALAAAADATKSDNQPPAAPVAIAASPQSVAIAEQTTPAPVTPLPRPKTIAPPGKENLWKDLIQNDNGDFDFGDFQMIIVTLLAVGTYLLAVHHALGAVPLSANTSLPDLDTTILSAFGLGQGAYLAKKAVGNASAT